MQSDEPLTTYTAFSGDRLIASGDASPVALVVKAALAEGAARVLVFEDATGREIDFNLQGTDDDIRARLAAVPEVQEPSRAGRGRPKLGVVSREVTLLPRESRANVKNKKGTKRPTEPFPCALAGPILRIQPRRPPWTSPSSPSTDSTNSTPSSPQPC